MPMDNRLMIPRRNYDADALRYLNAVQLADGQALEPEIQSAIDAFVRGCKADGIWSALKASCIMCGARTISGALVPLVGAAPTPYNFASGDYSRTTGLKGNGATKYLDSNRANDADGQDDNHNAVFLSTAGSSSNERLIGSNSSGTGVNTIGSTTGASMYFRSRCNTVVVEATNTAATGLCATSRSSSELYKAIYSGVLQEKSVASEAPDSINIVVFGFNNDVSRGVCTETLSFYSIGSALDLAALDNRVSTLVSAIAAAI